MSISLLLLLCNMALIGYIIYGKKNKPLHEGPRDIVIEKLQFDGQQIAQYDTLIVKHRKEIKAKNQQILELRKSLYGGLNSLPDANIKDSLMQEIGNTRVAIERVHYAHFEDMKSLCNENQRPLFEQLTAELAKYFNNGKQ